MDRQTDNTQKAGWIRWIQYNPQPPTLMTWVIIISQVEKWFEMYILCFMIKLSYFGYTLLDICYRKSHWWIPLRNGQICRAFIYFCCQPEHVIEQTVDLPLIWGTVMILSCRWKWAFPLQYLNDMYLNKPTNKIGLSVFMHIKNPKGL